MTSEKCEIYLTYNRFKMEWSSLNHLRTGWTCLSANYNTGNRTRLHARTAWNSVQTPKSLAGDITFVSIKIGLTQTKTILIELPTDSQLHIHLKTEKIWKKSIYPDTWKSHNISDLSVQPQNCLKRKFTHFRHHKFASSFLHYFSTSSLTYLLETFQYA